LERLEMLVTHIPDAQGASEFVYRSMNDVHELALIAQWETTYNVTVEQTSHINRIISRIHHYMKMVPNNARRDIGDDLL
jgi:hypothetical protein